MSETRTLSESGVKQGDIVHMNMILAGGMPKGAQSHLSFAIMGRGKKEMEKWFKVQL